MIKFLSYEEIDKAKWDDCLYECGYAKIYAFSWYLDRVHPNWQALVYGDYEAIFPLPIKQKYGVSYLIRPPFCQQLGLYIRQDAPTVNELDFLHALPPSVRWGNYPLNSLNKLAPEELPSGIQVESRSNYELPLEEGYATIRAKYKKNTVRNLGKASSALVIQDRLPFQYLIELKQANERVPIQPDSYKKIASVMEKGLQLKKAACWGVWDASGTHLLAGAYILKGPQHLIYLLAASSEKGKEEKAMFVLIDKLIATYSGSALSLDFEGSDVPGLARFYQGFGATHHPYPQLKIQRLPQWLVAAKSRIFPQK